MQRLFKDMMVLLLGGFALIYLMYPSFGVFELIPDAIPFIGSIDEAGATILLMNVLNYYNINVTNLFDNPRRKKRRQNSLPAPKSNQRNPDDQ